MNHHVPPVGQAVPTKRRNRVGASDTLEDGNIDHDELEMLRLEREDDLQAQGNGMQSQLADLSSLRRLEELEVTPKPPLQSQTSSQQPFQPLHQSKNIMMKKPKTVAHFNAKELTVKLGEKVVKPGDVLQHKNGTVYVKKIKCRVCNYRAAWESEMVRHELRVHGLEEKKKAPRPIPNLIPIQSSGGSGTPGGTNTSGPPVASGGGNSGGGGGVSSSGGGTNTGGSTTSKPPPPPILKIPNLVKGRSAHTTPEKAMSEKDLNDICAKSCPNSSLKDFASLIGDEEAFKNSHDSVPLPIGSKSAFPDKNRLSSPEHSLETKSLPDGFKKKNASFFDKLKEKLMTGAGESCNLVCNWCGHESKCLSESVRHKKLHETKPAGSASPSSGNSVISGAELSSTRCQHCRQRCKTSADLVVHLKSCVEAMKKTEHADDEDEEEEEEDDKIMDVDENREEIKSEDGLEENGDGQKPPHPMENKVFVWTNMGSNDDDSRSKSPQSDECSVVGIETAPGIGAVTSKSKAASHGNLTGNILGQKVMKMKGDHSVKKVYKCPHCSFWASTASRFHVHIVGHLNKKPFECSLCAYRSNWRWDITKHIRLKTVRDSSHERARVLMTDETGRRNYSKYNKYLTLMKVHEPSAESSGSGRRTKPVTQSYGPIEPVPILPAPPKLTPAPALHPSNPSSNLQMQSSTPPPPPPLSQHRPIYPKPPPLHSSYDLKRPMQDSRDDNIPKKKLNVENKKTMWKCKKCLFRDSDRSVVLAHVKEHYRNQCQGGSDAENRGLGGGSRPERNEDEHRLKQGGGRTWQDENSQNEQNEQNDDGDDDTGSGEFMCETCPFVCDTQQAFDQHMEYHFERPEATLRCYVCPYFVSDKMELKEHMILHRDSDGEEGVNHSINTSGQSVQNGDAFANKRYKCSICPYVSNSKSQFLYHKQFHRPRGAPFRCNLCSYNVTRRHLLHQHLRLHGINIPIQKTKDCGYEEFEEGGSEPPVDIPTIDTSNLPEIPLVWVSKLGNLTKMFKCRYCPHVNIRKSNIQEHEKMHSSRVKPNSDGTSPNPQQHHCPDCNYVCNNAGVLSSHAKVHQGLFGQVCSLVDLNRSDEAQIRELNALLGREEEGPPEILPHEINKEFKDNTSPPPPPPSLPPPSIKIEKDMDIPNSDGKVLHFCSTCPARFLYQKELEIHTRFHSLQLQFQCESCSYTARQQPHLLAHYKVHTDEYQDRTSSLCEVYPVSGQHPKPKIAIIVDGSEEVGPAWVVVPPQRTGSKEETEYDLDERSGDVVQHGTRIVQKQFACDKCPATFFKSVALQYHMTLHGGSGPHKCRSCDYAVKTYGNLIKHEAVHGKLEPRAKIKVKPKKPVDYVPTSGTDLFRHKTEAAQKVANTPPAPPPPPPPLHIDPEFGVLMHGSPEFIYPTYLKNGKMKEKRYKCHKCPSAFEKREQYKVHLSLHGSKQRYRCERCDYSVKYYANYIQHLRKHQHNDATKAERKMSSDKSVDESGNDDVSEHNDTPSEEVTTPVVSRSAKKMQLSMADQQTIMLMQQRVVSNSVSTPEVLNRCPYCPYSNQRKDGVGSHVKCHSNAKGGAFMCKHCDYTVPQQHFLREHNKLHFSPLKGMRPEAYMKCDRLELWSEPVEQTGDNAKKVLIFKDKGNTVKTDRFLPEISVAVVNGDTEIGEKTFINLKTGEMEVSDDSVENIEKDEDKENQEMKIVCKPEENSEDINNEEENASEGPVKTESVTSESDEAEEPVVNGDIYIVNNGEEDECGSDDDKKEEKISEEDNDQTSILITGSDSEDSSSDSSSSTDDSEQDSTSSSMTSTHQD